MFIYMIMNIAIFAILLSLKSSKGFVEKIDESSLKAWEANVKVHNRGLELIKPGAKCSEICTELNELFAELGYIQYRTFGYGHSFGMLSHFYGREAGLELREDIETVLEKNMVISMEPMIMIPEGKPGAGGYRESPGTASGSYTVSPRGAAPAAAVQADAVL